MLVYGEYSHHLSSIAAYSSPITDNDVKMFIKAYKEFFGTINSIWYYKINKNIKDNSKNNTNKTGNINWIRNGIGSDIDDSCNNLADGNTFSFTHEHPKKAILTPNQRICSQELIPVPLCII